MKGSHFGFRSPRIDPRISLIVGLAIAGTPCSAGAQGLPGGGTTAGPASPAVGTTGSAPSAAAPARAIAPPRMPAASSFQRVTTTRRTMAAPMRQSSRAVARDPMAMGQDDPFRPYSERVRAARAEAAMGTTRPQPRAAAPPRMVQSSRTYYPGMRISRHPNANTAQVVGSSSGMMGTRRCTTGRAGAISSAAVRVH